MSQNNSIQKIYHDLIDICDNKTDAFYYKDFVSVGGGLYRIFSYHLAKYSDFLFESSEEARGSLWEINPDGSLIRCAARPNKKFFNAYENPFVMFPKDLLSTEIVLAMDKRDGSVISTFMDTDGYLRTKSNASLHSEHAYNSTTMIHDDQDFYDALVLAGFDGYTTNLEYTTPEFRIVLPYQDELLTVLNLRHRESGGLLVGEELKNRYPLLWERSVFVQGEIDPTFPMKETIRECVDEVYKMKDIEGFVVQLKDGTMFKIKTEWYCALHFTRDSIMVDSRLYEVVLQGGSDDLRQLFSTDPYCLEKIEKMENLIFMCYNKLRGDVESFVEEHKHLDRKAFAGMVTSSLPIELNRQGLAFALYNGKEVSYKETLRKYMKDVLTDL